MTFEKKIHDFGEVGPQSKHTCEFRFRNAGTGVLKVRKEIDSTCGCTVPVLSKTEYVPGEEGTIQVTYVAGAPGDKATKSFLVYSNDTSQGGAVRLTIQATVTERVAYEPRQLILPFKGPDARCPPVTVRSLDHQSFSVTRILSSGGTLTADCDPSLQATEFTFRPTLDSRQLQKHPTGTLLLTLTHPECEEIHIGYQILPEFELSPPSLMLFNVEPNRPVLRDVWLSNNYGEDFEIASCTSTANLMEVVDKEKTVSEDRRTFRYRLRLSLKPPSLSGTQRVFGDALAIHLTNGSTLQLPCRIVYGGSRVPLVNVRVRQRRYEAEGLSLCGVYSPIALSTAIRSSWGTRPITQQDSSPKRTKAMLQEPQLACQTVWPVAVRFGLAVMPKAAGESGTTTTDTGTAFGSSMTQLGTGRPWKSRI